MPTPTTTAANAASCAPLVRAGGGGGDGGGAAFDLGAAARALGELASLEPVRSMISTRGAGGVEGRVGPRPAASTNALKAASASTPVVGALEVVAAGGGVLARPATTEPVGFGAGTPIPITVSLVEVTVVGGEEGRGGGRSESDTRSTVLVARDSSREGA